MLSELISRCALLCSSLIQTLTGKEIEIDIEPTDKVLFPSILFTFIIICVLPFICMHFYFKYVLCLRVSWISFLSRVNLCF